MKDNDRTDMAYLRRDLRHRQEPKWKRIDWWTLIMVTATIAILLILAHKGAL